MEEKAEQVYNEIVAQRNEHLERSGHDPESSEFALAQGMTDALRIFNRIYILETPRICEECD